MPNSDEAVLVLKGRLLIDLDDGTVNVAPDYLFTVERGVRHLTGKQSSQTFYLWFRELPGRQWAFDLTWDKHSDRFCACPACAPCVVLAVVVAPVAERNRLNFAAQQRKAPSLQQVVDRVWAYSAEAIHAVFHDYQRLWRGLGG